MNHERVGQVSHDAEHAALQAQLPNFVTDALEADERNAVASHIAECTTCQAEVEELRLLLHAWAADRHQPVVDGPSIADTVMEQVGFRTSTMFSTAMTTNHTPSISSRAPSWSPQTSQTSHDDLPNAAAFGWDRDTTTAVLPASSTAATAPAVTPAALRPLRPLRLSQHRQAVGPQRQPRPVLAGVAAVAVVLLIAAILLSRLTLSSGVGRQSSQVGGPSTGAAFTGTWRAAYLGGDGQLHFVSASGQHTTSAVLPGATFQHMPVSPHVGVSADGHYLAYIQVTKPNGSGPVSVVDLATGKVTILDVMATELHWAPDASRFVCGVFATGSTTVTMVDMRTGTPQVQELAVASASSQEGISRIVGWIDATHLAIVNQTGRLTLLLESLDLTTKQTRLLAPLDVPPDVFLSPDGKRVFIAPTFWNPVASVVDTATGSVRELPNITATFANQLQHLDNYNLAYGGNWAYQWAWQPGTHTIALSLSRSSIPNEGDTQPVTQQAGVWLIDLDHDQARSLNQDRYPLAWTPDGRTLLLSDLPSTSLTVLGNSGYAVGLHLYALSPVAQVAHGGKSQTLAADMVVFFGLIPNG